MIIIYSIMFSVVVLWLSAGFLVSQGDEPKLQ
jgi:hypothetical protein